jgi:hypothetical protein
MDWTVFFSALGAFALIVLPAIGALYKQIAAARAEHAKAIGEVHTIVNSQKTAMANRIDDLEKIITAGMGAASVPPPPLSSRP